ncbi:MAG: YbhB/YbcL family Raf kinase inhibitor-like protein [Alphaproteobacteria bacterium]|nr:YbhB/YbcL family Raf kinase inhibitor-like protein [Alphaproteobacteria bacterium]
MKGLGIWSVAWALLMVVASPSADALQLNSIDVPADSTIKQQFVFNGFGCSGENRSPALSWRDAPKDTKSFALTVYDPDAPTGSGWWHWLMIDIPSSRSDLPRGFGQLASQSGQKLEDKKASQATRKADNPLPADAPLSPAAAIRQIRNDYGQAAYGGPCPPKGDKPHRYIFTLFALKVERLDIPDDATAALAGFMIRANAIDQSSFTAYFGR